MVFGLPLESVAAALENTKLEHLIRAVVEMDERGQILESRLDPVSTVILPTN